MGQSKATTYFTVRPSSGKNSSVISHDAAFYAEDGTPLNEAIANLNSSLAGKAPVDHVHDGSGGIAGPGVPGKDGLPGVDGKDGKDGKDGEDGLPGADGKDGEDGLPGADGKDGQDGLPGADGKDGEDGLPGADGKDGVDGVDGDVPHDHDEYLVGDGPNDATDAFRIRSGDKTFVSLSGDELGLYHVKAPTSPTHVARLQDVTDADYAPTSHSHSYASSGHTHGSYAIKGSSKKIMQDDGSTGPVQFTVSGNNLYWST